MKYRIHDSYQDGSIDIITEDGGIASVYHNGENMVTNYYQTRLTEINKDEYIWDELSNSKVYCHDWNGEPTKEQLIKDALDWLVYPRPKNWELDNTIFIDIFNDNV